MLPGLSRMEGPRLPSLDFAPSQAFLLKGFLAPPQALLPKVLPFNPSWVELELGEYIVLVCLQHGERC